MREIARLSAKDREALFRNTAAKMGMTEAIVEKDFWVCWTLDYLFHNSPWKSRFAFKGGTSLSKSYGLIKRFSEDIDIILDWRILGYGIDEPWEKRSNTRQDLFNNEANQRAEDFLKSEFVPKMKSDIGAELGTDISLFPDQDNGQTINFIYPGSFSDKAIVSEIRLEIGALAAWTPTEMKDITPYAAEQYPRLFSKPNTSVLTVLPERTFWEKATILHREAHRPPEKEFPSRYSRHYYDLCCMAKAGVKGRAFADLGLLERVVSFKDKFYHCPWAKYEEAMPQSLRLLPPKYNLSKLQDDYEHMQNMIFGGRPTFSEMMLGIGKLEMEIHRLR